MVASVSILTFCIRNVTHVAAGFGVFLKLQRHDMGKDVTAVANRGAVRDVKNLSDAVAIPHGVWELPEVGRWCLKVMPDSGGRFFFDTHRVPHRMLAMLFFGERAKPGEITGKGRIRKKVCRNHSTVVRGVSGSHISWAQTDQPTDRRNPKGRDFGWSH